MEGNGLNVTDKIFLIRKDLIAKPCFQMIIGAEFCCSVQTFLPSRFVLPDCLENIRLVPVYQRAVLKAAWARLWEWAVGELREHVLKAEQFCVASHSNGRVARAKDNPSYKDSNLSCRDHNTLASMPLSRQVYSSNGR